MTKQLILFALLSFIIFGTNDNPAYGATRVKGYVRKSSGTYVNPSLRSKKDKTKHNNWSSKGNIPVNLEGKISIVQNSYSILIF